MRTSTTQESRFEALHRLGRQLDGVHLMSADVETACSTHPNWFVGDRGQPMNTVRIARATKICTSCPAYQPCRRWLDQVPTGVLRGGPMVVAGVLIDVYGRVVQVHGVRGAQ